jgi:DNA-binding NtrC family response regulator
MGRLLLVDDDEAVRITLAANLELEGFEIIEAESAEHALQLLPTVSVDVVLSDVRMAGMNGVDMFLQIKERHPDLPVILSTAFSSDSLMEQALLAGIFTLLPKPFKLDSAVRALRRAIRKPSVVVVDDVAAEAESLVGALKNAGVKAQAVYDAAQALELIGGRAIDVVVTDLKMPQLDGTQLVERIRVLDPSIGVIVFSGHDVPELMRRAASLGVKACMRKPMSPIALLQTIAAVRADLPGVF